MRDHLRILGTLFIAWAVFQAAGTLLVPLFYATEGPARPPVFLLLSLIVLVIGFGWVGLRLREHDPRIRVPAIVLSALALLSFPVGTLLGAYGLWVLLAKHRLRAA